MTKFNFYNAKPIMGWEWDRVVQEVYGKRYSFQQQSGCRSRGIYHLSVPDVNLAQEYDTDAFEKISEEINGPDMCVKFATWLARDPNQPLVHEGVTYSQDWEIGLWWDRNFYPNIEVIANDLYSRGILPEGEYIILIDWSDYGT